MTVFNDVLTRCADTIASEPYTISLHTGDPGATGASEVSTSGTGYQRVEVPASGWTRNGTRVRNTDIVSFPSPSGNWGTVSHYVVRRTVGGLDLSWSGAFQTPFTITAQTSSVTVAANVIAINFATA